MLKSVSVLFLLLIIVFQISCNKTPAPLPPNIQALIKTNTGLSLFQAGVLCENDNKNVEAANLYLLSANKGFIHSHYAIWELSDKLSTTESPFDDSYQFMKSKRIALKEYSSIQNQRPNDPELHYRLARLYAPGIGIKGYEHEKYIRYLTLAAKLKHDEATKLLEFQKQIDLQLKAEGL